MKKFFALLMSLTMVLSLAACGGEKAQENGLKTVQSGKLTMSTNAQFPPYEMIDDAGGFIGIDVEVAAKIAEKLGLELVVDDMEFDAALLAAQNGKSDMVMAGVTVNEERLQVMDFTNSYAEGIQVVLVKKGSGVSLENLDQQLIGVQRGTTSNIYCVGDFGEDAVVAYDAAAVAVKALKNGQVDCVVLDNGPAQVFAEQDQELELLDTAYTQENYAIGLAKNNTALCEAINQALVELQEDGTVAAIVEKYIPSK